MECRRLFVPTSTHTQARELLQSLQNEEQILLNQRMRDQEWATQSTQILDLLQELQRTSGMAVILITHNLGVVARVADEVAVMYAGKIVEKGSADDIFYHSAHPYTLGLRRAMPHTDPGAKQELQPIEGTPPDLFDPPKGCSYFARCPYAMRLCENNDPARFHVNPDHYSLCWLHHSGSQQDVPELFRGETV